jgi:hypothetical protein
MDNARCIATPLFFHVLEPPHLPGTVEQAPAFKLW